MPSKLIFVGLPHPSDRCWTMLEAIYVGGYLLKFAELPEKITNVELQEKQIQRMKDIMYRSSTA